MLTWKIGRGATMIAAIMLGAATSPAQSDYDLLIRNGRVIDGTGSNWFYADVAVRDGKIAAIGDLAGSTATETIDAGRAVVAPGFIDVHTHADGGLHRQPLAENFTRNGVTTIVTGNCGGSEIDVKGYFDRLDAEGVALNVSTLIGHNSILRSAKGDKAGALDEAQWEKARGIARKAMEEGAVGMSTGLIYVPGKYSDTAEIIELQKVVAKFGGIYATHMRNEASGILEAIDEAIEVAEATGSRVQISHFKMPRLAEAKMGGSDVSLARVYEARARGIEVWVDQYPYTASSTNIGVLFPDWVQADGGDEAKKKLQQPETRKRYIEEMRQSHEVANQRKDMAYAQIASTRAYPEFNGLNLKEVAQVLKLRAEKGNDVDWRSLPREQWPAVTMDDQFEVIADIYIKGGAGMVYHTMDESQVENIMRSPLVGVASDSGVRAFGEGVPHPRGYGTNARVLGRYVRERKIITLEDAIRKMTSMPATAFRFRDRGLLREGLVADIVIFDPEKVTDNATFEDPHHYATGFKAVLVNGVPVVTDDEVTGKLPGKTIRWKR